jgi:exo-beta-1,3-glucanase (GH17 family)
MKNLLLSYWMIVLFVLGFSFALEGKTTDNPGDSSLDQQQSPAGKITPQAENPFILRHFPRAADADGSWRAVSYGCFRKGQAPWGEFPSQAEILEDLNIISDYWNLLRVYNADRGAEDILQLIDQHKLPLRLVLGVWLSTETDENVKSANQSNINRAIELANKYPQSVAAINVGNESQVFWSGHKLHESALISYIRFLRSKTAQPVTTADDYNYWNKQESRTLAREVDFIITHIHPQWNGKSLDNAISWMDSTYQDLRLKHPDREILIGEIGWATSYNASKKGPGEQGTLIIGEVGIESQEKFLLMLDGWIREKRVTAFLFEVFDESWKGGGEATAPDEVEKHWGVFYEDRTPKPSFSNFLQTRRNRRAGGKD